MYTNAGSDDCVDEGDSQELKVKVEAQKPALNLCAEGIVTWVSFWRYLVASM